MNAEAFSACDRDGVRSATIMVSVDNPSKIPVIAEPFFQQIGAQVRFHPVMIMEDLKRRVAEWKEASKRSLASGHGRIPPRGSGTYGFARPARCCAVGLSDPQEADRGTSGRNCRQTNPRNIGSVHAIEGPLVR